MDLRSIIDEIAGQADDFLDGAASRREAKAGIAELINADHPWLAPADRQQVTAIVRAILDEEGFFDSIHADRDSEAGADNCKQTMRPPQS